MYFAVSTIHLLLSFPIPDTGANFIVPERDETGDELECHAVPHQLHRVDHFLRDPNLQSTNTTTWISNKLTCCFAYFLSFDTAGDLRLTTDKEMEDSILYTFAASVLLDGRKRGVLFCYVDEDADEDVVRRELAEATKKTCRDVFNRPEPRGTGNKFSKKLVRVLKALKKAEYLPDLLEDWYLENTRAYGRGGFHHEDPMIHGLMLETKRLVITANLG